jgi:putative component of toxin-antitoxin plasmid stabilization module
MPRVRKVEQPEAGQPEENKKVITEAELKREIVNAILHGVQTADIQKLVSELKESNDRTNLEEKLLPVIQRNLDRIVELVTDGLVIMSVKGGKKYNIYYKDSLSGKEVPFDVDYARDLRCGDEAEEERSWREIFEKSKSFLKEALGKDDLAKAFVNVFIEYATTPGSDIFEKYAPEHEKEKAMERMKEWEKTLKEEEKEKNLERALFEEEPTEEELRSIEEGKGFEDEYEFQVGEDFLETETLETDFDNVFYEDEELIGFYGEEEEEEKEEKEEEEEDEWDKD